MHLGFTPQAFSAGFDNEVVDSEEQTFLLMDDHADLITIHLAEGVPWNECLKGTGWKTWDPNVQSHLQRLIEQVSKRPDHKVMLALTPTDSDRTAMAGYWGSEANMPLGSFAGDWDTKTFDDPDVVEAYSSFVVEMSRLFDPDYVAYAIEVSPIQDRLLDDPPVYYDFVAGMEATYGRLKSELSMPLFASYVLLDEQHWSDYGLNTSWPT